MKLRVLIFTFAFLAVISFAHASWNIGWKRVEESVRVLFGAERNSLYVGFLPVT